jgi:hypothetical protein
MLFLSAPNNSIFTMNYRDIVMQKSFAGIDSLWNISLVFTSIGIILSVCHSRKSRNFSLLLFLTFLINYHFAMGNRELLPLLIVLLSLSFADKLIDISPLKVFFYITILLFTSAFFNEIRFLKNLDFASIYNHLYLFTFTELEVIFSKLITGTWSASLLTLVSVLSDINYYTFNLLFGYDYVELFLSLPPQVVADLFNYERPWQRGNAPASDMKYGIGGINILTTSIRNFGFYGPLLTGIFVRLFSEIILYLFKKNTVFSICWYCILVSVVPFWFWYGDKVFLNTIIISIFATIPLLHLGFQYVRFFR